MRLELFRYRFYDIGILSLEAINTVEQPIDKVEKCEEVTITDNENTTNNHLTKANPEIKKIFEELRSRIMQIDENIIEKLTAYYIAYRLSKNFAEIHIGRNQIKIFLRPLDYKDDLKKVEKIPESYNCSMDRRVYIKSMMNLTMLWI